MTTTPEVKPQDNQPKLYAGKFPSVEALEEGYKNSLPVFQENETLKKKLEDVTKIPDDYQTPTDVNLHEEDLRDIKAVAKNSALTQKQYEKLAREAQAKALNKNQSFENAKKELGSDKLNLMQDFLKKQYGDKAASVLLQKAIIDKDLQEEILKQRSEALNSMTPGVGKVSIGYHAVTQKDVLVARDEMTKSAGKARVEAQKRYIALQHQYAHQNKS